METTINQHRDSKNLQAPAQITLTHRRVQPRASKLYSVESVNNIIVIFLGLLVVLAITTLFLLGRDHLHNYNQHKLEDVSDLTVDVSAFTNDESQQEQYILTIDCAHHCSCLIYTNRKPFTNAEYESFWSIVEDNKNTNLQVINFHAYHQEETKKEHNNTNSNTDELEEDKSHETVANQQTILSGSHFYRYYVSCAQRSSKHLFPLSNSPTYSSKNAFSHITTHTSPIYFTYTIFGIIMNAMELHYNEMGDENPAQSIRANKYTSNIIPRYYKHLFGLKVNRNSVLSFDDQQTEATRSEILEYYEKEGYATGLIEPVVTTCTKHPSMIKLSAWIPRSLNVECRTSKHNNIDELELGSPFHELEENTHLSKTKYSNIIHRYADNFNDFNNAATVRFEMKLIGLSPGKHDLFCLVSKIDETMNNNNIQSQITPPIIGYTKVIEIKDSVKEDTFNEQDYTYKNMSNWFYRAGYIDLYVIFDFVYLQNYIKHNGADIKGNINIDSLLLLFGHNKNKNKNNSKINSNNLKEMEIKMIKQLKGFIKNIVNGNFMSKKELDNVSNTLSEMLGDNSLTLDYLRHLQLKIFMLLDLVSNFTTLSIVPIDILSNNVFKYYKLWTSIKQTIITIMKNKNLLFVSNFTLIKKLLFQQLKIYIILQKTEVNGKRKVIIDNCVGNIGEIMVKLSDCNKEGAHNVFKECKASSIDVNKLWNEYKERLENQTVNEVLDLVYKME